MVGLLKFETHNLLSCLGPIPVSNALLERAQMSLGRWRRECHREKSEDVRLN